MSLDLAFEDKGAGAPLVILHGLFGSQRNWTSHAKALAEQRRVITVDLRNHGASPWSSTHTYEAMAGDVAGLLNDLELDAVTLLGHSMGGKAAMVLALNGEPRLDRLIVVDIAPVAYDHTHADFIDAMTGLDLARMESRSEVDRALEQRIGDKAIRAFLMTNLMKDGEGYRWRLNLESLASNMDALSGFPAAGATCSLPTRVITGANSAYVDDRGEQALGELFTDCHVERIADAGHWVHAEQPERFSRALDRALRE
ncbi:MAG: alpha/beta fold hydrolase [Geminicoccaceae bacterium]